MTRELFVAEPRKTYNKLPPIVVDCSLLAAILFIEPSRDEALEVLAGKSLHVPNLIDHEIISVAVKKTEANDGNAAARGLNSFRKLRLYRHVIDCQSQLEVAINQKVSAYDATYLQLAVALNAPLATFDGVLASAARKVLTQR